MCLNHWIRICLNGILCKFLFIFEFSRKIQGFQFSVFRDFVYLLNFPGKFTVFNFQRNCLFLEFSRKIFGLLSFFHFWWICVEITRFRDMQSAGVRGGLCNPSYWEARIWGWLLVTLGLRRLLSTLSCPPHLLFGLKYRMREYNTQWVTNTA